MPLHGPSATLLGDRFSACWCLFELTEFNENAREFAYSRENYNLFSSVSVKYSNLPSMTIWNSTLLHCIIALSHWIPGWHLDFVTSLSGHSSYTKKGNWYIISIFLALVDLITICANIFACWNAMLNTCQWLLLFIGHLSLYNPASHFMSWPPLRLVTDGTLCWVWGQKAAICMIEGKPVCK